MPKEVQIQRVEAYEGIYTTQQRYVRLQGGAGSGKSIAIAQYLLITSMTQKGHRIFAFRKVGRTVKNSIFATFRDLISDYGLTSIFTINKTLNTLTCTSTGVEIICGGVDDPEKVKSIKDPTIIWMEEATEFNYGDFEQLNLRLRKEGIKNQLILSYNPISTENWIHDRLHVKQELSGKELYIKTTYKDNPFLPAEYKEALERLAKTNVNAYKVYTLGDWANLTEGLIFPNFNIIEEIPPELLDKRIHGVDFGFVDPMTLMRVVLHEDQMYIQQLYYRSGETIEQLIPHLSGHGIGATDSIYCDSAKPGEIQSMYNAGFRGAKPAIKGAGSIIAGIRKMHEYTINVTADSIETIKEFNKYCWKTDKDGNLMETPIDEFNHCFTASTKVDTINGPKNISSIVPGDLIHTSNGYHPCLKKFNNGKQRISLYLVKTDISIRYFFVTNRHKIWTAASGWKEIQEIQRGDQLSTIEGESLPSMMGRVIFRVAQIGYTVLFGKIIMGKFLMGTISITMMATRVITISQIYRLFRGLSTCATKARRGIRRILNGGRSLTKKAGKLLRIGTSRQKGGSGTGGTQGILISGTHSEKIKRVKNALPSTSQKNEGRIIAQIGASQKLDESLGLTMRSENAPTAGGNSRLTSTQRAEIVQEVVQLSCGGRSVYDIMVNKEHEYYANGVLAHNCIDGIRYPVYTHTFKRQQSGKRVRAGKHRPITPYRP